MNSLLNFIKIVYQKPAFIIIGLATIFYLPILLNPNLILRRGNDLQEQFWPVFYFIKQQLFAHHTLPLWNNLFFSGIPLLPDPQFPLFYPPYILFLLFPIDIAFLLLIIFHIFSGGIGSYLVAKHALGLSKGASVFTAMLFLSAPRLAGYLEAGHLGLVEATAWLPFIILATWKLVKKPTFAWTIFLAISFSGVFYTHTVIFLLTLPTTIFLFIVLIISIKPKYFWIQRMGLFLLCAPLTFGLTAITLLPQIEWIPQTTRFLLLQDRDVYPKWLSYKEFLQNILTPWLGELREIDTEKWLTFGFTPLLLALIGFFLFKKKLLQSIMALGILGVVLIALNNLSPIYPLFVSLNWYVLMRVSTRVWFIPTFLIIFLAGFGLDRLKKQGIPRVFIVIFAIIVIGESVFLSWERLFKPIPSQNKFATQEIYEFLEKDHDRFRVFCLNRCLSQKEAAKANLELVEGYNTIQQRNYYQEMLQLTGSYWNYYTLSLPPIGAYIFEGLKPDARSLGEFNVKYVISPYVLADKNFVLQKKYNNYSVYQNLLFQPRAYFLGIDQKFSSPANIIKYSPNTISVDTSSAQTNTLVLAEVWSPGWKAYLNGQKEVPVLEKPNTLRAVEVNPKILFVDFRYEPESYKWGRLITLSTLLVLFILILKYLLLYR